LAKVAIIEDERELVGLVRDQLEHGGHRVIVAYDGPSGVDLIERENPDLVILDVMLPGFDGLEVCRQVRRTQITPILMLTAKSAEIDKVVGLELGADDYITKPVSPRELVLRVKSVMRRAAGSPAIADVLDFGDIHLDRLRHEVRIKGTPVEFTATEFKLLALLIERRGRVQSRDTLLNEVWGYESAIDTRTVDTHIRRLRDKLGPAAECIETVRGFGYRIAEPS
jgi:two-component system phosphate regulon response regulator PhoB